MRLEGIVGFIDPLGWHNKLFSWLSCFFPYQLVWNGKETYILGVVYDPSHEELFVAEKGKGAQLNWSSYKSNPILPI